LGIDANPLFRVAQFWSAETLLAKMTIAQLDVLIGFYDYSLPVIGKTAT